MGGECKTGKNSKLFLLELISSNAHFISMSPVPSAKEKVTLRLLFSIRGLLQHEKSFWFVFLHIKHASVFL